MREDSRKENGVCDANTGHRLYQDLEARRIVKIGCSDKTSSLEEEEEEGRSMEHSYLKTNLKAFSNNFISFSSLRSFRRRVFYCHQHLKAPQSTIN